VTKSAYNIFYRRRDWHEKNMEEESLDFDRIAQKPDMSYVGIDEKKDEVKANEEATTT